MRRNGCTKGGNGRSDPGLVSCMLIGAVNIIDYGSRSVDYEMRKFY
jgi:hypothetical protein